MKHQNLTFSIPEDLKVALHVFIGRRGMSRFISDAVRKALEEEMLEKEQILDTAYEAANRDTDRLEVIRDWNSLDDVHDLIDDNEDWGWLKDSSKRRNN
jgi:metal-responsive CopG/Arc/MetJ family transcriptional regulator